MATILWGRSHFKNLLPPWLSQKKELKWRIRSLSGNPCSDMTKKDKRGGIEQSVRLDNESHPFFAATSDFRSLK